MTTHSQTTATVRQPGQRLPTLTGLRGVACLMVLLCHLGVSLAPRVTSQTLPMMVFGVLGVTAVSFFFVLSGFVLTWVARPDDTPGKFWRARAVKIFPGHLVVLAAAVLLMLAAGIPVALEHIVPSLLLVQAWFPVIDVVFNSAANDPSWSLACEVFFYALFPGLLVLVRRIPGNRLWMCACAIVAVMAFLPFAARALPDQPLLDGLPWWEHWLLIFAPPVRALEFVLGMVTAEIVVRGRWRGPSQRWAWLIVLLGMALTAPIVGVYKGQVLLAVSAVTLIAAAAADDAAGRSGRLARPFAVQLGTLSLALFLVHWPVIAYGPIGMADPASSVEALGIGEALLMASTSTVLSFVAAWLLYRFVETPAVLRWGRRSRR